MEETFFKVEILFNSGTRFDIPSMDERFVERLNFAKGRNEVFAHIDPQGNSLVIDTAHISLIRSTQNTK